MKLLLLLVAVSAGMATAAQSNLCALPLDPEFPKFMIDLVKPDPIEAGVFYLPKATKTNNDSTLKWVIYRIGDGPDVATTDSYIAINDFEIIGNGQIAVVGQLEDRSGGNYNVDKNPVSYSIFQYGQNGPTLPAKRSVVLNAVYRQYHFDPAGYLAVTDNNNNRYYFKPDGTTLGIDPTLPAPVILSSIYPGKNALYCISKNLQDPQNITYTLYQSVGGGVLMPMASYTNQQTLAHLRTGKFLVKNGGLYSVYDPDANLSSKWLQSYQSVGNDSILFVDDKGAYFFVDGDMDAVKLCADNTRPIQQVSYCPGNIPRLLIRYTNNIFSLSSFDGCDSVPPQTIVVDQADTVIPLFQTKGALYSLVHQTETNLFRIYRMAIAGDGFAGTSTCIYDFTTTGVSIEVPNKIALWPIVAGGQHVFLLVVGYSTGLSAALMLSVSPGTASATVVPVVRNMKVIQFKPGGRFLFSSPDLQYWEAIDVALNNTLIIGDHVKPSQIDRFYRVPCSEVGALYYFKYVDNGLKMRRYSIPRNLEARRASLSTRTSKTNPKRNGK